MKRLLLITLIVITFILAGVLHGGYLHEHRAGSHCTECAHMGNYPEQVPDVIFDSTVISPPLR